MGISSCRDTSLKGVPTKSIKSGETLGYIRVSSQDNRVTVHNYAPEMPLKKSDALLFGIYLIQEALGLDEMPEECDLISLRERYKELKDAGE